MAKLKYKVTTADRRPHPRQHFSEEVHLGFDASEATRPFANFLREMGSLQPQAIAALRAGICSPSKAYGVDEVAERLSPAGYEEMENGWAIAPDGTMLVSVLTNMPGVAAEMWDWWFGWHSTDSARYKLWHPKAHQFAALGEDRSQSRGLDDRKLYRNNVSYVDELIGKSFQKLAIRFFDPSVAGFQDEPGTTIICARAGSSEIPVAAGWLFHQVRPTAFGSEMRSRFFLGYPEILDIPSHAVTNAWAARLLTNRLTQPFLRRTVFSRVRADITEATGRDLFEHCAGEMGHLASFLPELYEKFQNFT